VSILTSFLDTQTLSYQTAATVSSVDEFGNITYTPSTSTLSFVLSELDNSSARRLGLNQRIGTDLSEYFYLCACVSPATMPSAIKEGFEASFTLLGNAGTLRVAKILETSFSLATSLFGQQFVISFSK